LAHSLDRGKGAGGDGLPEQFAIDSLPPAEAETLIGSMNVSFVAHELSASPFGSEQTAHESVLAHFLNTGFLWERIRMRGGAYGAGAVANALEGLFGFTSYRDPNTSTTLEAFREALVMASTVDLGAETFEKIVLGAAGKEDRPMAPGEKSSVALKRTLLGITDQQRQSRRDALIACTPGQLREAAGRLLSRFGEGVTVFLTHEQAMRADQKKLEALGASTIRLPD
jgi:Zn-dependent M16 (insulinase) family peptidase